MSIPVQPPPHAPELGLTRRLLGPFHITGIFWFRFHRWGISILPEWGVKLFTVIFTTFFFVVLRRIRKAVAANLTAALGPCGWWERQRRIYRTLWSFAWCLSERYEALSLGRRGALTIDGEEIWRAAEEGREGWILVTAHIGHWEVGSQLASGENSRHLHVVREEEMDPKAQEFIRRLVARQAKSEQSGLTMHFAHDDAMLGTQLLKALRKGEIVAVQGDRPRAAARSVSVELFGRPFDMPAGPAALARAAGVAMVPVFVFRRGRNRSRVAFRPPIRVAADDRDFSRALRQVAAEVEWAIRSEPHQWFCFRDLWPD